MSGLALRFARDSRPITPGEMTAMLDVIAYRGPDGQQIHLDGPVGMGFAKLAVTPEEEAEMQPLRSPRSACALIGDVRLDNRADLFALLPGLPKTASDAALVLALYEERGVDAFARLLGDFAVVLWDPREQRIVCARDTSGQRPLYYRLDTTFFTAASEIQQLLLEPGVPVEANIEHLRASLTPYAIFRNEKDSPETYYQGIYSLPAGHLLVVRPDSHQLRAYWQLEPPREIRYRTDAEYAEHYRALFLEVLRARLRTSRPVGVLLSGGLDSSSVACGAQHLYREGEAVHNGFATFTSVFDASDCDERPYIENMRDMYGFDAHFVPVGQLFGRLQLEPDVFRDAPNMGIAETRDGILREAHQLGIRTLLTGDMADACVFGSRLVFDSLLKQGHLRAFARHLRAYRRLTSESLAKTVAFACIAPLLPLALQRKVTVAYAQRTLSAQLPYLLPSWIPEPLRRDLAQQHLQLTLALEQTRLFANETRQSEYQMLYPPEMAASLSPWPMAVSRPFADRRLHAFLLAIPPEQKFEPHPETDDYYAGSKQIVRRAMRGILPESIRTRTDKTNFNSVAQQEIEQHWPLYTAAFGPGSTSHIAALGLIDPNSFWARLQVLRTRGHQPDSIYVMRMAETETWLRSLNWYRQQQVEAQTLSISSRPYLMLTTEL